MLTHLSLFSGIGGLDLAAEMAGIETIGQCEWADYPTKILERHWPGVARWRDIRTLTQESFYEKTGRRTVDVISGGFPCQPFSVAGSRKGRADDRFLWPEMLRVIRELRPTWVIGENVGGLVSMAERVGRPQVESRTITRYEDEDFYGAVLVQQEKMLLVEILEDIRALGYDVQAFVVPAAGVGAPHRRDRIAIVARYADRDAQSPDACLWQGTDAEPSGIRGDAAHADGQRREPRWPERPGQAGKAETADGGDDVAHSERAGTRDKAGKAGVRGRITAEAGGTALRQADGSTCTGWVDAAGAALGDTKHDGLPAAAVPGGTFETGDDGAQGQDTPGESAGAGRPRNHAAVADADHAERRAQRSARRGLEERPDGLSQREKGSGRSGRRREDVQHALGERREEFDTSGQSGRSGFVGCGRHADVAHAARECGNGPMLPRRWREGFANGRWWDVEPAVGRVAHGVPHRVDSLKCLGNAVVPQQFYPFFAAIVEIESEAA